MKSWGEHGAFRMNLHTYVTPSHEWLLHQWLKPFLPSDLNLIVHAGPQECLTAKFRHTGWRQTMAGKINAILHACAREDEPFVYADADIQFFTPTLKNTLLSLLGSNDIAFSLQSPPM